MYIYNINNMSEKYYRYNSDNAVIDLENDEIYDYVLERENLKELNNSDPQSLNDFSDMHIENTEHFGNLTNKTKLMIRKVALAIIIIVIIYFLYIGCIESNESSDPEWLTSFEPSRDIRARFVI